MFERISLDELDENRRASAIAAATASAIGLVLGIWAIYVWLVEDPTKDYVALLPMTDGTPLDMSALLQQVDMEGTFETFDGTPSDMPGNWPWFRGANYDNISKSGVSLADSWGSDGPEVLWKIHIGEGYASPAVYDGVVYLLDYDMELRADAMRALSLDDGKEIWRRSYQVKTKRNHGMSRTIPAVTEDYLLTVGPKCHVVCLDRETGDFRWGIDLQMDYGTEEPMWYTGQCPIIEDGVAIIAPGGPDVMMMGVNCESGEIMWQTPNPRGWKMSHSSVVPMTLLGKKMYVYAALGGLVGVSAGGDDVGELLWDVNWGPTTVAPSPVQSGDDEVFMTAGYGNGHVVLQLSEENGVYSAEVTAERGPTEGLACEQQTPIFHDGLLYSIMPKDRGPLNKQFVCFTPGGEMVWSSGQDNRFGLGPFMLADDKFYILSDDGILTMLDARSPEYVQLGQADVVGGHDAWGPLTLAGSRMIVRNMDEMACVELGAG